MEFDMNNSAEAPQDRKTALVTGASSGLISGGSSCSGDEHVRLNRSLFSTQHRGRALLQSYLYQLVKARLVPRFIQEAKQ